MFWNNFVNLCNNKGKSPNRVCADLGYSTAIATKWKNGAVPRDTTLKKIADYFDVTVDYLLGKTSEPTPRPELKGNAIILDPSKTRMIPVYESVSAGVGVVAQNLILEYMPIYIHSDSEANETICIKVTGDSMSPDIEDGDMIQVHKQTSVDSGSVAVVLVDGEEALVKKVIYDDNHVELHSFNPKYQTLSFSGAELMRIQVLGLVKNTLKSPHPHRINNDLDTKIAQLSEDLSPSERLEVEQFIAYLKSKR